MNLSTTPTSCILHLQNPAFRKCSFFVQSLPSLPLPPPYASAIRSIKRILILNRQKNNRSSIVPACISPAQEIASETLTQDTETTTAVSSVNTQEEDGSLVVAEYQRETISANENIWNRVFDWNRMGSLGAMLKHLDDLLPLLKLKMAVKQAEKQIPPEPHWGFCYTMLPKVSRSFALVIQQLDTDLRDVICIFYLVLRALDTVEDDTSIATEVKVPILMGFHRHIYDREWHFSCGTKDYKLLMDEFHHVSTAFLQLGSSYQEAIEDITMRMGAGMAKFICKEVESIDDYDEYCHYVSGLVGLGLSKLFHASGKEELAPDSLSNSMGLFLQKTNIIREYLEDINEIPKSRMIWPRQIWSKYVDKLEDLKSEENSVKAVQCLNDMITDALMHVEDCLKYMSALRDPAIFRFCAIPQVMEIGALAMCYNNIEVFRGGVKMRPGLTAKVIDRTKSLSDVYGGFYDFTCMLKSKVDDNDPNAEKTKSRVEVILKTCKDSGTLNKRKSYVLGDESGYNSTIIVVFLVMIAVLLAYPFAKRGSELCKFCCKDYEIDAPNTHCISISLS